MADNLYRIKETLYYRRDPSINFIGIIRVEEFEISNVGPGCEFRVISEFYALNMSYIHKSSPIAWERLCPGGQEYLGATFEEAIKAVHKRYGLE